MKNNYFQLVCTVKKAHKKDNEMRTALNSLQLNQEKLKCLLVSHSSPRPLQMQEPQPSPALCEHRAHCQIYNRDGHRFLL